MFSANIALSVVIYMTYMYSSVAVFSLAAGQSRNDTDDADVGLDANTTVARLLTQLAQLVAGNTRIEAELAVINDKIAQLENATIDAGAFFYLTTS